MDGFNPYTFNPPPAPTLFGRNATAPSGPLEGALQSILPMLAESIRQQTGGYGFNFGSDMNIASSQLAREFLAQLNQARVYGARADTAQVNDMMRGFASLIGHRPVGFQNGQAVFGADVEGAIGRFSSDASAMLPVLAAMFPDFVDRMMPRGSMTVAAGYFANAGRFTIDPATGQPISADPMFAERVLAPLAARGPAATAGLGMGRLGGTFEELAKLGMIQINPGVGAQGLSALGGVAAGEGAREFSAAQVRGQLERYSETISAINDVFADAGQPNAPLSKLIGGIQRLTQGGLQAYDPQTLGRMVRQLQAASTLTGIDMGQMEALTGGVGALLRGAGADARMAAPISLYAAAMGNVYADPRFAFGAESFEGVTRGAFMATVGRDAANAAGSDAGNMIGAILYQAQYAPDGSPLRQAADALRAGQTTVNGLNLLRASGADVASLFTQSGLSEGAFYSQLRARGSNQAGLLAAPGAREALRAYQRQDIEDLAASQITGIMGFDAGRTRQVVDALFRLGPGARSPAELAQQVGTELGLTREQVSLLGPAIGYIGELRGEPGQLTFGMFSGDVAGAAGGQMGRFEAEAERRRLLAPLGRGGMVRNVANAIREAQNTGGGALMGALLRGAGMVYQAEVDAALEGRDMEGGVLGGAIRAIRFQNRNPLPQPGAGPVSAGQPVDLSISIAQLKIIGDGANLTGSGASTS